MLTGTHDEFQTTEVLEVSPEADFIVTFIDLRDDHGKRQPMVLPARCIYHVKGMSIVNRKGTILSYRSVKHILDELPPETFVPNEARYITRDANGDVVWWYAAPTAGKERWEQIRSMPDPARGTGCIGYASPFTEWRQELYVLYS